MFTGTAKSDEIATPQTSPTTSRVVHNPRALRVRRVSIVLNHIELDDL